MKWVPDLCSLSNNRWRRFTLAKYRKLAYLAIFLIITLILILTIQTSKRRDPPIPDFIIIHPTNSYNFTIENMVAQEEQLMKLINFDHHLEPELDLTPLPSILNRDVQAYLPSKNHSLTPMFKDADSEFHFINFRKLAEYARLHDRYWRTYNKLVDLIPSERHQYNHHKVKSILKASLFQDPRLSHSHGKILLEFLGSFEILDRKLFHWLNPSYESLLDLSGSFNKDSYAIAIAVNDKYAIMGSNLVLAIRNIHRSDIPIHIYYAGDTDLNPLNQNMLRSLARNVELHDLSTLLNDKMLQITSYSTKVFAQLLTPAQHVMLLDADVVLLQPPERAFTNPHYQKSGTLFFMDRQMEDPVSETVKWFLSMIPDSFSDTKPPARLSNHAWFTGASKHIQESGMVVINKSRHLTPLLATCLLNKKVERDEVTYQRVFGDKETFWIGMEIIGHLYTFSSYEPHPIGDLQYFPTEEHIPWDEPRKLNNFTVPHVFCSCHMLHFDHDGDPFWINGGLWDSKGHTELGLANYTNYSTGPGQWKLYDEYWGCYRSEEGTHPIRALEPSYRAILNTTAEYYTSFYNDPLLNPSKQYL